MSFFDGKGPQTPRGIWNKMYSRIDPNDKGDGRQSVETSYMKKYDGSLQKSKKTKNKKS